nr:hypothetical protein [Tanacetum cinerariifolium]GEZ99127.1 hypothetical protein [Tanacetum cinerariifolium]
MIRPIDTPVDWWLTGGGKRWSAIVDRRWLPSLTTSAHHLLPRLNTVDQWSGVVDRCPIGSCHVATAWRLMIIYKVLYSWRLENKKVTCGTWRLSKGSVRGAGGQVTVQGSERVQYEESIPEASRWTGGII